MASARPRPYQRAHRATAQRCGCIDLGAPGAGAQSEPSPGGIGATDTRPARRRPGATFTGGGRAGVQVTARHAGAPGTVVVRQRDQKGQGIRGDVPRSTTRPTKKSKSTCLLRGRCRGEVPPIVVPRREVRQLRDRTGRRVARGPSFATVFATSTNDRSIVVERVITSDADGVTTTSVVAGAPPRQDGYYAQTWHVAPGAGRADPRRPRHPKRRQLARHDHRLGDRSFRARRHSRASKRSRSVRRLRSRSTSPTHWCSVANC